MEMSVNEETVNTGRSRANSTPSVQLSECTGSFNNISIMAEEVTAATHDNSDIAATCPVSITVTSPNHISLTDTLTQSDNVGQRERGNENNINRRNSLNHSKQQKLSKRRSTSHFGFKYPMAGKRRRRANSLSFDSVLPTNFLLGGNIFDPLNLNSLLDEEVNRALNAETPKSSPLPAKSRDPVEILIPRDITDPLNLNSGIADSSFLVSPYKSGGKKRHRNRHHGGGGGVGGGGGGGGISATQLDLSESGKSEVKTSKSTLLSSMSASCSTPDVPKGSSTIASVSIDSHRCQEADSTACKEEMSVSAPHTQTQSVQDFASSILGGPNQYLGRRKRRRNSGKMEPPVTQSTPIGKPGSVDGTCGMGTPRNSQSFHTPRSGPRAGPAGRHQQHFNQQKEQQRKKFQYGNYNKYYGYRNPGANEDPRVRVLRPEWFQGKNVLDLGCNSGHLTLYIAKMLRPAHILGLDIDSSLVHAARKNIRHYLSDLQTHKARRAMQEEKSIKREARNGNESGTDTDKKPSEAESMDENEKPVQEESGPVAVNDNVSCHTDEAVALGQGSTTEGMKEEDGDHPGSCSFPVSLRISRGPIAAPPLTETSTIQSGEFPSNVSFITANYVLENNSLLFTQRPEYDVILCLSVTKWVHLNWGDNGLKRLFQRVYRHLRPGGLFILEPQPWESYARRRKLTEDIARNYHSIHLKPDKFSTYLINEVGFSSYEFIGTPTSSIRGFQRPIYLFHK